MSARREDDKDRDAQPRQLPGQSQRSAVQADCIRRSSKILDERKETTTESAKAKAPAEESDTRRCRAWNRS